MRLTFGRPLFLALTQASRPVLVITLLSLLIGCQSNSTRLSPDQASAVSHSYQCKNDVEVQCDSSGCESEANSFTAMSVDFDDTGNLSVCAYSGCWQGQADLLSAGHFTVLTAQNLKFSTSDDVQNIAIILDRIDGVAVLKAGGFAQPLLCETSVN